MTGVQLIFDRAGGAARALGDRDLVELYRCPEPADGAWLRSNFVATVDGSITGADGRSGSIGTPSDARLFALQRALADAVLVAGGTARAEGYRAVDLAPWQVELRAAENLAPHPTLVIVSGTARVDPEVAQAAQGEGGPVVVVTTEGKPETDLAPLRRAGVEVLEMGRDTVDLRAVVDDLAGRGLPRLLCEGGPTLHRDLLAAGLVDELCLTVAPSLVGGAGARTTAGEALDPATDLALDLVLVAEDGTLFTRYRTLPERPPVRPA